MISTRPRIEFDEDGVCNACRWAKAKKNNLVDWAKRNEELELLIEKTGKSKGFDIVCPVSGGKDSSYVAYMLKKKGLNFLMVTLQPPLPHEIGLKNLEESIKRGGDHIRITPNFEAGRRMAKKMLIERGMPLWAWTASVQTAIFRVAVLFKIPMVMFGEEGETEYGGSRKLENKITYDVNESIGLYLSGHDPVEIAKSLGIDEREMYWWQYPTKEEISELGLSVMHWSYFEDWNPYRNYLTSKEHMGLAESPVRSIGTYNNFAQTDTKLYDLHTYLMFLKFGFGRCTQDVCIDIRRGAITRKQGINLIKAYDGEYPEPYIKDYLEYFQMSAEEFDAVLDKWVNKDILVKHEGRWNKKFEIE
jgi:N-acetyl sugar amidotransferase